jgi:hypothetical protein
MRVIPLIIISTLMLIIGCASNPRYGSGGSRGTPRIPKDKEAPCLFTPVPSVINIPLEIKTSFIEKTVNEQLPRVLYECDTLTLGPFKNVKVTARRKGNIRMQLQGNELIYKVPLQINLRVSLTIGALGFSHTEYQDVEAGITIDLRSKIFLNNDWSLVTVTKPQGYTWTSDPVVKVRSVSIPVKPVADFLLSKQFDTIGELIDKTVSTTVDVKEIINPLWLRLQEPAALGGTGAQQKLWLRLTPESVYKSPIAGRSGSLQTSLGIRTVAETFIGEKPPALAPVKLPNFTTPGKIDSTFTINLYSEISYEQISLMSRKMLMGIPFKSGKHEIIVEDIEISGIEGFVLIRLDLTGSFRGRVFVIGEAVYDEKTQTMAVKNLSYDMTTQNRLHKSASWLLRGVIISKMEPLLRFSMKETLQDAQAIAQFMLKNNEVYEGVYLNGKLNSLSVGGIALTDSSIRTVILAKGTLSVRTGRK